MMSDFTLADLLAGLPAELLAAILALAEYYCYHKIATYVKCITLRESHGTRDLPIYRVFGVINERNCGYKWLGLRDFEVLL